METSRRQPWPFWIAPVNTMPDCYREPWRAWARTRQCSSRSYAQEPIRLVPAEPSDLASRGASIRPSEMVAAARRDTIPHIPPTGQASVWAEVCLLGPCRRDAPCNPPVVSLVVTDPGLREYPSRRAVPMQLLSF